MKTYNVKETASRIRELRKKHRYTQEQAAELLEIDRRSLSNIENAAKGCSLDLFIRMANTYHVTLDYLLFGDDTKYEMLKAELDTIIGQLTLLRDQL